MSQNEGTGTFIQVREGDWEELNRALRYTWNQLDALAGRRGNLPLGSNLDLGGHRAIAAADPTADTDLVTKGFADANYGARTIRQELVTLQQGVTPLIPLTTGSGVVIIGTHSQRVTSYVASGQSVGAVFFETDRDSAYIVISSAGTLVWQWAGGTYQAALASIPVDLGASDAGFRFYATDSLTVYIWTGSLFVTVGGVYETVKDAVTNAKTTVSVKAHTTSGAATTGFGLGETDQLQDSAAVLQSVAYETVEWSSAATVTVFKQWSILIASVLTLMLGMDLNGLTCVGDYIWKSFTNFTGTLAHNNSGNRTYTFADESGNMVYETADLTNNNFVFGAGGAKAKDAGFSIVPVANGGTASSTATGARAALDVAQRQTVGGNGAGTYTTITSITVTSEGTVSAISGT